MNIKKSRLLFALSLLIFVALTGCGTKVEQTDATIARAATTATTAATTTSETIAVPTPSRTAIPSIQNNEMTEIMFIGNSLTDVGQLVPTFTEFSKTRHKVDIVQKTPGGYKLSQHLEDLKKGWSSGFVAKADIVVLQEYGSPNMRTADAISEIQKLFGPETKFYYLLTEFDIDCNRMEELKNIDNLTYIPSGTAHNILLGNGFTYAQLHALNDYHPNALYGYVAALTAYSVIYDESCIGLPYEMLKTSQFFWALGNTDEKLANAMKNIQENVMKAVNSNDYNIKQPVK